MLKAFQTIGSKGLLLPTVCLGYVVHELLSLSFSRHLQVQYSNCYFIEFERDKDSGGGDEYFFAKTAVASCCLMSSACCL